MQWPSSSAEARLPFHALPAQAKTCLPVQAERREGLSPCSHSTVSTEIKRRELHQEGPPLPCNCKKIVERKNGGLSSPSVAALFILLQSKLLQ